METRLYVGNLSKTTTQEELSTLFAQAGEVVTTELVKDRKSGEPRGFAFITMSAESEADSAISMFNTYSLSDHALKVSLAKPKERHGKTLELWTFNEDCSPEHPSWSGRSKAAAYSSHDGQGRESQRINLNIGTMIYRPIRQVFDFMSAPENDPQWQYGTLATARLSEGASATGTGTIFRSIGHLMGQRNLSTFEIAAGSTKITVSTQANLVDFSQVGEGDLEKKMKEQLKENLVMLKSLLEARQVLRALENSPMHWTRYWTCLSR